MTQSPAPARLLHDAIVTRQTDYGHGYFVIEFACDELAAAIDVGQFVNLRVRDEALPLLRRPFSVFDVLADAAGAPTGISMLYHVVGVGTRLMSKLQPGARVSLNGPLGLPWPKPAVPEAAIVMAGGGIGLAPFLLQARRWPKQEDAKREFVLVAGGRSEHDLRYMKLFSPLVKEGVLDLLIATEDGSAGFKGRVTAPLRSALEARARRGEAAQVYCCGPTPMMAAVGELCRSLGTPCMASLESVMACGYGVCNGCVTKVRDAGAQAGFRYVKTCVKGTAFDEAALIWN